MGAPKVDPVPKERAGFAAPKRPPVAGGCAAVVWPKLKLLCAGCPNVDPKAGAAAAGAPKAVITKPDALVHWQNC